MPKLDFSFVSFLLGIILTLVLLAFDKAGKLKGPWPLVLLALAAILTLPLVLGVPFVTNAQGLTKSFRAFAMIFLVGLIYSLLAAWVATGELSAVSVRPSPEVPAPIQLPQVQLPQVKRILLTPGSHVTPPGPACTGNPETPLQVAQGDIAVFFGDCIALTKGTGTSIVAIDGESVLSFKRATGQMYLDAVIRDSPGHEVGRIDENVVRLSSADYEALNPDAQNLAILNKDGKRVLSVRYVNEFAMVVSGIFYGKMSGPFWVSDGEAISLPESNNFPQNTVIGETCFENHEGPLFQLGRKLSTTKQ